MNNEARYLSGKITGFAFGGDGVMRHQGRVIFVPQAAENDEVCIDVIEDKKSFLRGRLISISQPSSTRITPPCPQYFACGGCHLQHVDYQEQLRVKQNFVKDALMRIAKIPDPHILPIIEAKQTWAYRRHIRLHVKRNGNEINLGFIGRDNHTLVAIEHCFIFEGGINLMSDLKNICLELHSKKVLVNEIVVHKTLANRLVVNLISPSLPSFNKFKPWLISALKKYPSIKGIVFGDAQEIGDCNLNFDVDGLDICYGPDAFVQANEQQSELLYLEIRRLIKKSLAKIIVDLYCGIGATSLLLAREGLSVMAIEGNPRAVDYAKRNAKINRIDSVEWMVGDVDRLASQALTNFKPHAVLVNPPRTGLGKHALSAIMSYRPQHIFYISCMPATLARDLKLLHDAGYDMTYCRPYDMFPQTTHVETLVQMTAVKFDQD
jgi:23S rRNA (uracil1939-C5)-methyltransferase